MLGEEVSLYSRPEFNQTSTSVVNCNVGKQVHLLLIATWAKQPVKQSVVSRSVILPLTKYVSILCSSYLRNCLSIGHIFSYQYFTSNVEAHYF